MSSTQSDATRYDDVAVTLATLREKEERLRLALAAAEMGTWDWDPETDELAISPEIQRMLKLPPSPNPIPVSAASELIHPDDLSRVRAIVGAAVDKGTSFRVHFRARTTEGAARSIVARGCALRGGPSGEVVRVIGVARDVTSRDQQREAHRRMAATMESDRAMVLAVMSSMTDGLIVANATREVRYCSDQAAQLLGSDPEALLGQNVDRVGTRLLRYGLATGLRRAAWQNALVRLEERPRLEVTLHHPTRRDFEVQFFPIAELDPIAPSIGIVLRDVSHLKLLSLLRERERIAMDLHDGVIQSLYALGLNLAARERMLPPDLEEARGAFRQAQEQLAGVIQEARSFIVDLRLEHAPGQSLGEGLEELAGHLQVNGLTPDLELANLDGALPTDATPNILYIAREAISNVLRHARASAVQIRLARLEDGLSLTIRDNGLGFDPRKSGRRSGDGLRNMAERTAAIGGTLRIESEPGEGTVIELRCPSATPIG